MDTDNIRYIASAIQKEFNKYTNNIEITLENFGKCISAKGINDCQEIFLWIRILPSSSPNKYIVDISSISLPKTLRNKGIFTKLVKLLRDNKYVHSLCITSVCTKEMYSWCYKHKDDIPLYSNNNYPNNFTTNSNINMGIQEFWKGVTKEDFLKQMANLGYMVD